jgi:hypothetical protein
MEIPCGSPIELNNERFGPTVVFPPPEALNSGQVAIQPKIAVNLPYPPNTELVDPEMALLSCAEGMSQMCAKINQPGVSGLVEFHGRKTLQRSVFCIAHSVVCSKFLFYRVSVTDPQSAKLRTSRDSAGFGGEINAQNTTKERPSASRVGVTGSSDLNVISISMYRIPHGPLPLCLPSLDINLPVVSAATELWS